ncbi:DUF1735 domain-containing protein [Muribaculum sp.]|uniref:BT_3987 domain-containing protein n=1 Tax=Muribaculum sp. TaxID=1918611 RepID=UPI0023C564EC|nr:DUF1735 domain-containing protein [Muribaculum sp.]MDE5704995.1 DUF1735 and LamG domain-containing protein [Muribaculum sp.]MDE5922477.1 DUF1735 and LamG domain-containing protein [Muribaculum sp.]
MKLKAISYLAVGAMVALTACSHEGDNFGDRVLFTGTENSPVVKFLCDGMSSTALTVTSTAKATADVHITVKAAPELLDAYNKKYNRSFVAPEPSMYQLEGTDAVIKAGSSMSSQIKISSNSESLAEGVGYMLPITITEVNGDGLGVIESSRTAYVQFTKVVTIKAGLLNLNGAYEVPAFRHTDENPSPVRALGQMTLEMKVFPLSFGRSQYGIGTLVGCEENFLFRFGGGDGTGDNNLQFVKGSIGDDPHPDKKQHYENLKIGDFDTGRWIHFAAVYDGTNLTIYRDCERISTIETSGGTINLSMAYNGSSGWFDTFTIGSSCHNRFFHGYISECRVWTVPRSVADLENGICYVDPTSDGLLACWRFDGETNEDGSIRDVTGHGYDAVAPSWASGGVQWVEGQKCPY